MPFLVKHPQAWQHGPVQIKAQRPPFHPPQQSQWVSCSMQCRPWAAQQPAWSHSSLLRPLGSFHLSRRAVFAVQAGPNRPSAACDGSSSSNSLTDSHWGELTAAAPPRTSYSSGRAPPQPVTNRPSTAQGSSRDREDSRGTGSSSSSTRCYTGDGNLESLPAGPRSSEQRRVGTSGDQYGSRQRSRSTHTIDTSSGAGSWDQGRNQNAGFSNSRGTTNSNAASSSRPGATASGFVKRKPDKKAKKAAGLPPSNQPCCYGCGAPLQTVAPAAAGYVVPTKFELKQKHKQLNQVLCVRCSELCNGAMIPAVQDFTQKAWAQQQAGLVQQKQQQQQQTQQQQKQPDLVVDGPGPAAGQWAGTAAAADLDNPGINQSLAADAPETLLGKVLITPEQLRDKISEVRSVKAIVVLLVDLLDASGTLMSKVRDMVGNNPIILVGTKMDLLPADCHPKDVAGWLSESAARKKLQVASCHLVSSHTGEGIAAVTGKVCRERKGRDVFVVGAANVGKSAFVRAMLKEMSSLSGGNFDAAAMSTSRYLPVESAMPGTTLGLIALKAFETGGTLYDTPGVHLHHRIPHMLTPDELKLLHPRRRLTAFTPPTPLEVMSQHTKEEGANGIRNGARSWDNSGHTWSTDPQTGVSKPRSVAATYIWGGLVRVDVLSASPSTHLVFYGPKGLKVYDLPLLGGDDQVEFNLDSVEAGQELFCQESVRARCGLVSRDLTVPAPAVPTNACLADIAVSGLPGWIGVYAPYTKRDIHLQVWTPRGVEVFLRPPLPCPTPHMTRASEDPPELLEIGGALDTAEADQEWVAHKESLGLGSMSKQDEEVVKVLLFGDEAAGLSGIVDEYDETYGVDALDSDSYSDSDSVEGGLHSDHTADGAVGVDIVQDGGLLQQLIAGVAVPRVGAEAKAGSSKSSSLGSNGATGGISGTSRHKSTKAAAAVAYDDEFGSIFVDADGDGDSAVVAGVDVGDGCGEQPAQQQQQSGTRSEPHDLLAATAGGPTRRRRMRRSSGAS